MKIGAVSLSAPLIMAPLAGITDLPFRLIAKEAGCGLVCSEMVSANGLVHASAKTCRMLTSDQEEKPLSVQIFGSDPAIMAEAARIVAASGADIIDVNFGCSVRKILKAGSGAALMRTPDEAEAILTAMREAVTIPLTIKIRSGWDPSGDQALALARRAEACGVDAITIHPRTATQGFGGKANVDLIRRVKQAVAIPVIGNGDIVSPNDAAQMLRQTGCDGLMIGRRAIGHPWIFSQVIDLFAGRSSAPVSYRCRQKTMARYLNASVAYYGEPVASRMMRSRLGWFVKGLPHSSRFREEIKQIESRLEGLAIIDRYFENLAAGRPEDDS